MFKYSHDVNTYIIYTNIVIRFFNIKFYMYCIFYILINIKILLDSYINYIIMIFKTFINKILNAFN
jgi:hypothetical protein